MRVLKNDEINLELVPISSVLEITSGQSPDKKKFTKDGSLPFHQGKTHFTDKYINNNVKNYISYENSKKNAIKNSILMSIRAPVGEINFTKRDISIGRGLISFTLKNIDHSISYFYYILKYNKNNIANLGKGTTFKGATTTDIKKLNILFFNSSSQQKKIANLLDKQQSLINSYKEKLSVLEQQEQYYQDKLLSGEIRIKLNQEAQNYAFGQGWIDNNGEVVVNEKENGFKIWLKNNFNNKIEFYKNKNTKVKFVNGIEKIVPLEWSVYKLKDFSLNKTKVFDINGYQYLEIGDINVNNKKYNIKNKTKKAVKGAGFCKKGTILISTVRPSRQAFTILKEDSNVSNAFVQIKANYFVYSKLYSNEFKKYCIKNSKTGTYPVIKKEEMLEYEIIMPYLKNSIEKFLFDSFMVNKEKIKKAYEKKIQLEEQKMDYLMDKLLSGELQVVD